MLAQDEVLGKPPKKIRSPGGATENAAILDNIENRS